MAKQLTITDPTSGVTYTLEYTRKTVEMMEKRSEEHTSELQSRI